MWLIDTTTLELHEYIDAQNAPRYAILSHRWGDGEVSHKDFRKQRNCVGPGYTKILNCCNLARQRGHDWVWVDTCCIDKRSSAELSEAINSMYSWYERSVECLAYLHDVTSAIDSDDMLGEFRNSTWFTRGWTLQELIAPCRVTFVNANWDVIGARSPFPEYGFTKLSDQETLLERAVADITGFPGSVLTGSVGRRSWLREISVAQKMSWMARRLTTRVEDLAYCLLGIFEINMPLLYGEGMKAFQRLQEAIYNRTSDESIFAWSNAWGNAWDIDSHGECNTSMFAPSPGHFASATDFLDITSHARRPLAFTSSMQGLELTIPEGTRSGVYERLGSTGLREELLLRLDCGIRQMSGTNSGKISPCVVLLNRQPCGHFTRNTKSHIHYEHDIEDPASWSVIYKTEIVLIHLSSHNESCIIRSKQTYYRYGYPVSGGLENSMVYDLRALRATYT